MSTSEQTAVMPGANPVLKQDAADNSQYVDANAVMLLFKSGLRCVLVDEGAEIMLGRPHPTNTVDPQVDLTAYGAAASGVSRLHVTIRRERACWWITDLDSSNGTWVNGQRLAPQQRYQLRSANEIQLARLALKVMLIQEHWMI